MKYTTKNNLLLHRHDLIKTFSDTREASLIPGIHFKVLPKANYDLQNLVPFDVSRIFSLNEMVEELKDNKHTILEIDNGFKADNDEEGPCN